MAIIATLPGSLFGQDFQKESIKLKNQKLKVGSSWFKNKISLIVSYYDIVKVKPRIELKKLLFSKQH